MTINKLIKRLEMIKEVKKKKQPKPIQVSILNLRPNHNTRVTSLKAS
jgi:hypothetical protein